MEGSGWLQLSHALWLFKPINAGTPLYTQQVHDKQYIQLASHLVPFETVETLDIFETKFTQIDNWVLGKLLGIR